MLPEFTSIELTGKFDCSCSLIKEEYKLTITPKSVVLICKNCQRTLFYRRILLPKQ